MNNANANGRSRRPSKGGQCYAYNCNNYRRTEGVSLHKFPSKEKYPKLFAEWVKNCGRAGEPSRYALLCCDHFAAEHLDRTGQIVRLRDGAVPTIFSFTPLRISSKQESEEKEQQGSPEASRCLRKKTDQSESHYGKRSGRFPWALRKESNSESALYDENKASLPSLDHSYIRNRQKSGQNVGYRRKRLREDIMTTFRTTCKGTVTELYEKKLIDDQLLSRLKPFEDIPLDLFKKKVKDYSKEQIDFVVTVLIHSPEAYRYMRTTLQMALPDPRSLKRMADIYEVIVIKEGYCTEEKEGKFQADGSITLLKGKKHKILVDTGGPADKYDLILGLSKNGVTCEDIDTVIGTHGHSDHIGNLNLFPQATFIVSYDICKGAQYTSHDFKSGKPYVIEDGVEVHPTPGHTGADISLYVEKTQIGSVLVAGDLFECEADMEDPTIWQAASQFPDLQAENRQRMLSKPIDYIIPGHGPMFKPKPLVVDCAL